MTQVFSDGLQEALQAQSYRSGPLGGVSGYAKDVRTSALGCLEHSGMMKKVINITAEDRVREWRDWQADKEEIELLEREERRLDLKNKIKQAETLRAIGGGALILITLGDHEKELNPEAISQGGLIAINVVSRCQITPVDFDKELTSPNFGMPKRYEINGNDGKRKYIHASRVVPFRGRYVSNSGFVDDVSAFWGDCLVDRVHEAVTRSDCTTSWFSLLVQKSKSLRFGIPNVENYNQDQLNKLVARIAAGESIANAIIFRSPSGPDDPGEVISDYQVSWGGIPDVMDAFDQRVAAVSDIPFTRLMGRSPAGMNSTGAYDDLQWVKTVKTGQELEVRPCLEYIDKFLIPSAGIANGGEIWFEFAPLSVPTEKEATETFKTKMEAISILQATNTIPQEAFNEGVQNVIVEGGYLPGLDQVLADIPEDERFGVKAPKDDGMDPSAIQM